MNAFWHHSRKRKCLSVQVLSVQVSECASVWACKCLSSERASVWECKCLSVQVLSVQVSECASVWACKCLSVQVSERASAERASVWACKCLSVQVSECASVWTCKCLSVQVSECASVWACKCLSVQVMSVQVLSVQVSERASAGLQPDPIGKIGKQRLRIWGDGPETVGLSDQNKLQSGPDLILIVKRLFFTWLTIRHISPILLTTSWWRRRYSGISSSSSSFSLLKLLPTQCSRFTTLQIVLTISAGKCKTQFCLHVWGKASAISAVQTDKLLICMLHVFRAQLNTKLIYRHKTYKDNKNMRHISTNK